MIILIDDEKSSLSAYIDEIIEHGYEIITANDPDQLFSLLRKHYRKCELVIVDIYVASGKKYSQRSAIGSGEIGILVIKEIKQRWPKLRLLAFTKAGDTEVLNDLRSLNIRVLRKQETLPYELIDEIENILRNT